MCIFFVLTTCDDFDIYSVLGEGTFNSTIIPNGALTTIPEELPITVGSSFDFDAEGGSPPYTFEIVSFGSGSPEINETTEEYTAGPFPGTDTIRVADSDENIDDATVDVGPPPDYTVLSDNLPQYGSQSAAFSGDFTILNNTVNNGYQDIDWELYRSADNLYDGGDSLADFGSEPALLALESTDPPVNVSGTWPAGTDTYWYLIVLLKTGDDNYAGNDTYVSAAIPVPSGSPYEESEPNDSPRPEEGETGEYNDIGTLSDGTITEVTGDMDGVVDEYDTFLFTTGTGVINRLDIICTWSTEANDIDLFLWVDGAGSTTDSSQDTSIGREPDPGTAYFRITGISSEITYRIDVKFKTGAGGTYHLFIQPNQPFILT